MVYLSMETPLEKLINILRENKEFCTSDKEKLFNELIIEDEIRVKKYARNCVIRSLYEVSKNAKAYIDPNHEIGVYVDKQEILANKNIKLVPFDSEDYPSLNPAKIYFDDIEKTPVVEYYNDMGEKTWVINKNGLEAVKQ